MSAENIYTSIACNRTPESADWSSKNGMILFAACNSIALLDPDVSGSAKIRQTFVEHTARVNTVKWISDNEFLSGSYDNLAILWNVESFEAPKVYKLIGHEGGVTFVDAIKVNGEWTIVSTSMDSTIRFWHWSASEKRYITFDTISLGNGFCFALSFALLPDTTNQIILAYSTDENHIYLLCDGIDESSDCRKFTRVDTLIGHVDWVRGLDFVALNKSELLLASVSQDTFIRLWKISARPAADRVSPTKIIHIFGVNEEIQMEERIFTVCNVVGTSHTYAVALESVLLGHDGWVYGVHWMRTKENRLQLLSSSIDKTLIIWAMQEDSGVWMEKVRVGEVGGNSLGFYGGKFSADCMSILGHGYQGSFHLWHLDQHTQQWTPGIVVGGHFDEVRDLCWNPKGDFLLTTSADQTTRCHAPWRRHMEYSPLEITWHELARPQVHGYDMQTICALSRYRFASGAEEKIVRTFQAPANFVQNFRRICDVNGDDDEGYDIIQSSPKGASVPSLGLSNKAVYDETASSANVRHIKDEYPENFFVPVTMNVPPTEETLMQNTLWPEVQKLYGHGYEIFALAATSDGKFLASSCRATNEEHAQIILWNTSTWKQLQKLTSHQLTVTQMKFSPDNQRLLSVSRDRRWTLFENKLDETSSADKVCDYRLISTTDKKNGIHVRIIWTCDWSHDGKYFGTGSRDGKVVAWHRTEVETKSSLGNYKAVDVLDFAKTDSVTAIAFAKHFIISDKEEYLAAIGLEIGCIHLCSISTKWVHLFKIDRSQSHHLTIKRLAFRPSEEKSYELASCGDDHIVRIYNLKLL